MPRVKQPNGSLKWIQKLINDRPGLIDDPLSSALRLQTDVAFKWKSPLRGDDYAEYSDAAFLKLVGVKPSKKPLAAFWPKRGCDWTKRFYQYANRLAHLYFLREMNGIDAYLVFLYFLHDPYHDGLKSELEWRAAIKVMHEALGIRGKVPKKYVADVFVDVGKLG